MLARRRPDSVTETNSTQADGIELDCLESDTGCSTCKGAAPQLLVNNKSTNKSTGLLLTLRCGRLGLCQRRLAPCMPMLGVVACPAKPAACAWGPMDARRLKGVLPRMGG